MTELSDAPGVTGRGSAPIPTASPTALLSEHHTVGLGRRIGYLLTGLPLGIAAFTVAVAGFSLGVSTLVISLGVLVLAATLWAARGLATVERRGVEWVTGRELPPHLYRVARPGARTPSVALAMLRDPQAWRDLLHAVLAFPVRVTTATLTLSWALGGLGGLLFVTWEWALPADRSGGLFWLLTGTSSRGAEIAVNTVLGALVLIVFPWLVRGMVAAQTGLARGLLTNQTAALRARTEELASGRRAAASAEATTLRRLERDIHDGPQQRLVRMTMDLEATSRRLDDDPDSARPLLDGAITQSREVLAELRALSRGIAPPVLADRGLAAALRAAAARSPIPVTLDVIVPDRLPAPVENAAYFVVAEALTNVAKHASATQIRVRAAVDDDRLTVTVADDGEGGAHVGRGHGLAGLADRMAAVDGTFGLTSPRGGPTVVTATLPTTAA